MRVDITSSWVSILPLLITAIEHGTHEGKRLARQELIRMAKDADAYKKSIKVESESHKQSIVRQIKELNEINTKMIVNVVINPAVRRRYLQKIARYNEFVESLPDDFYNNCKTTGDAIDAIKPLFRELTANDSPGKR